MTAPTVDDLHAALIEVAGFLEEHRLPFLREVRLSVDEVGRGDGHGAQRYLHLNRALLDIYFSPVNGNAANQAEAEALQSRFEALHSRAFTLADTLLRNSQ
jgi:hypothetical protein